MSHKTIISGLELKFGAEDGTYRFLLSDHDNHTHSVRREIYLAIPEFAKAEEHRGKKKWVSLVVERTNPEGGFSSYCLASQNFHEDQSRPDLLLFHYMHTEPLLCERGERFSASPKEVYEAHDRWAFPTGR